MEQRRGCDWQRFDARRMFAVRCPRTAKEPRMTCHELARRIELLQPDAAPRDVARLCLLLSNAVESVEQLEDEDLLARAWHEITLRVQAATDQHAAMTEELENLSRSDPQRLNDDQVWILIRAIKVQSQILQMYVGESTTANS